MRTIEDIKMETGNDIQYFNRELEMEIRECDDILNKIEAAPISEWNDATERRANALMANRAALKKQLSANLDSMGIIPGVNDLDEPVTLWNDRTTNSAPGVHLPADYKNEGTVYTGARGGQGHYAKIFGSMPRETDGFKNMGEYLSVVASKRTDDRLKIKNTIGTTVPSEGGFLIPDAFRADLIERAIEGSNLFRKCDIRPMPYGNMTQPAFDDNDHSADRSGISAGWIGEGEEMSLDDPKFRSMTLKAKKLYILIKCNNEWLHDAPGADQVIRNVMAKEIAWQLDHVLLNTGTGVTSPLSFLNGGGTIEVAAEGGQAAGTFIWENAGKMYEQLNPAAESGAEWWISPSLKKEVLSMYQVVGTGGTSIFSAINQNPAGGINLLGKLVNFSEHCAYKGTKGDAFLIDPRSMLVGLTQDMRIDTSAHYKFQNDQTLFRAIIRLDAQPKQSQPLTLADGTHTVSDSLVLAAR